MIKNSNHRNGGSNHSQRKSPLKLSKETVRDLSQHDLAQVVGGKALTRTDDAVAACIIR
jgi:hypothetical protein